MVRFAERSRRTKQDKIMIGAIIGDIAGSDYEFNNIKTKQFPFFTDKKEFTDDSILTIATAKWILEGGKAEEHYAELALEFPYPMGGYGGGFNTWLHNPRSMRNYETGEPYNDGKRHPYYSCGNGSAMRICPVGWAFDNKDDVMRYAKMSAECTHNHPEGIKGAQATAMCIFMGRNGSSKEEIRKSIEDEFGYDLSMTVEELQKRYSWRGIDGKGDGGICQESVPQAIICALKATDFEDAIRNAISIGGDSDTIGCITGGIAEALYGVPEEIRKKGMEYLPARLAKIVNEFEGRYGRK